MSHIILPPSITKMVDSLDMALDEHGQISLQFNYYINHEIEQLSLEENPNAGYFRRAKWALAAAYHVLPLWLHAAPQHMEPKNVLDTAMDCLYQQAEPYGLCQGTELLFENLVHLTQENEELQIIGAAAFSCYAAARVVAHDLDINLLNTPVEEKDPEDWEACFYASIAYSGGATWNEESDNFKRKEFWQWYFKNALPNIWSIKDMEK